MIYVQIVSHLIRNNSNVVEQFISNQITSGPSVTGSQSKWLKMVLIVINGQVIMWPSPPYLNFMKIRKGSPNKTRRKPVLGPRFEAY